MGTRTKKEKVKARSFEAWIVMPKDKKTVLKFGNKDSYGYITVTKTRLLSMGMLPPGRKAAKVLVTEL